MATAVVSCTKLSLSPIPPSSLPASARDSTADDRGTAVLMAAAINAFQTYEGNGKF